MMHIKRSIEFFFRYIANLASMIVSHSGKSRLSFPVFAIISFMPTTPRGIVLSGPIFRFPFAKAFVITKIMAVPFDLIFFSCNYVSAIIARYFQMTAPPSLTIGACFVLALPLAHASTRAKIIVFYFRRDAFKFLVAYIAFDDFFRFMSTCYYSASTRTRNCFSSFQKIRFNCEFFITNMAIDFNYRVILPEIGRYVKLAGSGTVGCAAENEGRLSVMVEKLPKYCSVILERMKDVGLDPVLVENIAT